MSYTILNYLLFHLVFFFSLFSYFYYSNFLHSLYLTINNNSYLFYFVDVMEHKIKSLKRIFKKQKKKSTTEMESLLASSELDGEEDIL